MALTCGEGSTSLDQLQPCQESTQAMRGPKVLVTVVAGEEGSSSMQQQRQKQQQQLRVVLGRRGQRSVDV